MKNVMTINGYQATISYDPEIEMFRGEFVGLNGGADFYASNLTGLKREGKISLKVFRVSGFSGGWPLKPIFVEKVEQCG